MYRQLAVLCALFMVALLVTSSIAFGQEVELGKRLSARLGVYMPTDSDIKDAMGSSWLDMRLGYRISANEKAEQIVEIGLINAPGKTFELTDGYYTERLDTDARIIPITYTYKVRPSSKPKSYYGFGGGLYLNKLEAKYTVEAGDEEASISGGDSTTKLGLHAMGGINFSENLGAELGYTHMLSKWEGFGLNGWSFRLSGRF